MSNPLIVPGRPDFADKSFGITKAKRHVKYVYSNDANGCLIHKVREVTFHWYEAKGDYLERRQAPHICIKTICSQVFFAHNRKGKRAATMCEIPSPDAVLCGRCHGEPPVFTKGKSHAEEKRAARARLGCVMEVTQ